jgi:hypothetical protein
MFPLLSRVHSPHLTPLVVARTPTPRDVDGECGILGHANATVLQAFAPILMDCAAFLVALKTIYSKDVPQCGIVPGTPTLQLVSA